MSIQKFTCEQPASERTRFKDSQITNHESPLAILPIQFQKLNGWRLLELDAEMAGDLAQSVIEMRKMIQGHIANEGAANLVVARAAVQPANEKEQLEARRKGNDKPVKIHMSVSLGFK
jgi:hypothetical protein